MPGKMARSGPQPPLGLPDVPAAIHISRGLAGRPEKRKIHASSRVIWGICAKRKYIPACCWTLRGGLLRLEERRPTTRE